MSPETQGQPRSCPSPRNQPVPWRSPGEATSAPGSCPHQAPEVAAAYPVPTCELAVGGGYWLVPALRVVLGAGGALRSPVHLVLIKNTCFTRSRILDISFNLLRNIEGVDKLTQLKKLFLVNNKISKIENLSSLRQLQMLELGSNRIRVGAGAAWARGMHVPCGVGVAFYFFPETGKLFFKKKR